nr:MAG TPA: Protein trafficking PGA2 [Caudoviricetes sp.]
MIKLLIFVCIYFFTRSDMLRKTSMRALLWA